MYETIYFTLKALFVFKIFKFLSWFFGHVRNQLDKVAKFNFKVYNVMNWGANNYNISIGQYLQK